MNEYLFIYRGGEMSHEPAVREQTMRKWGAWFTKLRADGHLKSPGQPLERAGKVVRGASVTDGPYAETKEVVGGYSIVTATDLAQAVELAKGCPLHDAGGSVEVRQAIALDI